MLNICHFIASKGLGRGEFYIDLVNEIVENTEGITTILIPVGSKYLNRINNKINVIEYKSKDSRTNPLLYIELYNIFRKNNFDIVHTHFAKSTEIFFRLNKILNIIHIATKHNPRKGKIFNKIKYVTAVSDDVAKSILKDNVKIIYNGIKPVLLEESKKNEIFTIRAIGRLDKIKGFDKLIKDFSNIKKECKLEIVGYGEEYSELKKLVKDLKLEDKVNLLGFREDIPSLIKSSDMVVMSSISEGFSIVMIESIFYAKLFISTKVSGCRDLLPQSLLIENFEISKKITEIMENIDYYYKEFGKVKIKYQQELLLKNVVVKYLDYYEKVIKIENSCN